jgi:type IV pilus secretin PilQ/predicted competence protein
MKTYWSAQAGRPIVRIACLLLVSSAALATLWAGAGTAPAAAATSAIASVEVGHSGQQTTVRVAGTGPLTYHVLRLTDPPRLVVDFYNARLTMQDNSVVSSYVPVRGVRLGHPEANEVRVVIDLQRVVPFSIQNGDSSCTVSFDATVPTGALAAIPRKPVTYPASVAPTLHLPESLVGMNRSLASPNDMPPPPPVAERAIQPTIPQPQGTAGVPVPTSAPVQEKRYTGDPISVDLKDVDLKDFFRLIHEISGLNVVLDPAVHGTVTLVLDEVPWDQALDIVLQNNGLSSQIQGNVLRIATQDTLKKEADERRDLARAQSESVELVMETRTLSYGNATKLRDVLKKFLSPRGDILADDRTNTLIIRDVPAVLPSINDLIRQLDRKSQQVEIEARVVSASRSFARDVGTQFGFAFGNGNNVYGGLEGAASAASPITHTVLPPLVATGATASIPLLSNFPAVAPTSGFTFSNQSANFALDFMLSLMESKGVGKLLSEPEGVTQNNEKLIVKQGQQIPIQTTINNTISTQYIDAVLELSVTPQITADGTVFLDVDVENTQVDNGIPRISGIPALDTQSATSKVTIRDGGTIVVGGVIVSQQTTNVNQVPLLGNIPLIGNLFKETSVSTSSQELLFFITPRILPD